MHKFLNSIKGAATSKPAFVVFVLVSYTFFTFVSMAPSIVNCGDTLSGLGDNTGGPIWRASIQPEQPLLGGYENQTNYPSGENLYSPVGYASYLQTVLIKGATKVVGPVCAYNTMNMLSFMLSAIVMCAFIYYLLKSKWIAWLAGYAVAFTPYIQSKIGGHPSYGFVVLLIAVFWMLLLVLRNRKYLYGLGLAVSLAVCAYFDPYFILFVITILGPAIFFWLCYSLFDIKRRKRSWAEFWQTTKVLIVACMATLVLLAPLAYIRVSKTAEINSTTSSIRGDITAAAMLCSNLPQDYLLPDPYNLMYIKIFGADFTPRNISLRRWCGPGESRVAISLAMILTIVVAAVTYLIKRRPQKSKKIDNINDNGLVIGMLLAIGATALLLGLPPRLRGFVMPSGVVIHFTDMWRIFAREYLVLNMVAVILFSIALAYMSKVVLKNYRKITGLLFVLLTCIIFIEYQYHDPFKPFTFSYKRDVPQVYQQMKNDASVRAIAEYPLDRLGIEADSIVYYTTMQTVHQKPMLNSAIALNPNEKLHNSIKDLSDPQTIPVLRSLGITHVIIHGMTAGEVRSKTDQLDIIKTEMPAVYGLTMIRQAPSNEIIVAKIKDGPTQDTAVIVKKGFIVNLNIMKDPLNMEYETLPDPELGLVRLPNKIGQKQNICFDVKMAASGDTGQANILINGKIYDSVYLSGGYTRVSVDTSEGDTITVDTEPNRNLRLNNLGCL